MNVFKRFVANFKQLDKFTESLKEVDAKISEEVNKKFDALTGGLITDISDLKSDYLKKYVETRLDCNQTFIKQLATRLDMLETKCLDIEHQLLLEADR
jgi:hypothetical protein